MFRDCGAPPQGASGSKITTNLSLCPLNASSHSRISTRIENQQAWANQQEQEVADRAEAVLLAHNITKSTFSSRKSWGEEEEAEVAAAVEVEVLGEAVEVEEVEVDVEAEVAGDTRAQDHTGSSRRVREGQSCSTWGDIGMIL